MRARWLVTAVSIASLAVGVSACGGGGGGGGPTAKISGTSLTVYSSLPEQGASGDQAKAIENGAKLEILMTIDDPDTFNQPWQALRQYDRVNRTFVENPCSENNLSPFGIDYGTPVAEKADF